MAKVLAGRQTVPLEEGVLAPSFELQAVLNVLERKGLLTKVEVLDEITRLRVAAPASREAPRPGMAASFRSPRGDAQLFSPGGSEPVARRVHALSVGRVGAGLGIRATITLHTGEPETA